MAIHPGPGLFLVAHSQRGSPMACHGLDCLGTVLVGRNPRGFDLHKLNFLTLKGGVARPNNSIASFISRCRKPLIQGVLQQCKTGGAGDMRCRNPLIQGALQLWQSAWRYGGQVSETANSGGATTNKWAGDWLSGVSETANSGGATTGERHYTYVRSGVGNR